MPKFPSDEKEVKKMRAEKGILKTYYLECSILNRFSKLVGYGRLLF